MSYDSNYTEKLPANIEATLVNDCLALAINAYAIDPKEFAYFISPPGASWHVLDIYHKKSGFGFRFTDWVTDDKGHIKEYRWFITKLYNFDKKKKKAAKSPDTTQINLTKNKLVPE